MTAPGRQGDEQPLVGELVAAPLEYAVIEQVGERPAAAAQAGPAEPDPPLRGPGREVDHDQVPACARSRVPGVTAGVGEPGPGEEVAAGIIVGPAAGLQQLPGAGPHPVAGDD